MSNFLLLPSEIYLAIFKGLTDPLDTLNLSSTCRTLRSLFSANTRSLLRPAASAHFHSFDDLLRAARASKLPIEWPGIHFDLDSRRYPAPPTKEFCAALASDPPTFEELLTVREISRLISEWLKRFFELISVGSFTPHGTENFYRAGARFLLMSYLFSGAFLEPLRGRRIPGLDTDEDGVKRFPPYHAEDADWRYQQLENLYGGFIDWIVEEGGKQEPPRSWIADPHVPTFNPFRKILRSVIGIGPEITANKRYSGLLAISSLLLILELCRFAGTNESYIGVEEMIPEGYKIRLCHFGQFLPKFEAGGEYWPAASLIVGSEHGLERPLNPSTILQDVFGNRQSAGPRPEPYRPHMDFFRIALKNRNIAFYHEQQNRYSGLSNFYLFDRSAEA